MNNLTYLILLENIIFGFSCIIAAVLYRVNRTPIFKLMLIFWVATTAQFLAFGIIQTLTANLVVEALIGNGLILLWINRTMLEILHRISNLEFTPKRYLQITSGGVGLAAIIALLGFGFSTVATISTYSVCLPTIYYILQVHRHRKVKFYLIDMLSIIYLIALLHLMDYPFLRLVTWFAPYGFSIHTAIHVGFAVLLPSILISQNDLKHFEEIRAKERQLRTNEERYRLLMDNIDLGITQMDTDYRIVLMNRKQQVEMCRKPLSELLGRHCYEVFEKREAVCPHCPGKVAMETRSPSECETRGINDDGSSFPVRIQAFSVFDADGKPEGFIEVVEDITERKRAEAALNKAQNYITNIIDSMPSLLVGVDTGGRVTQWNKTAEQATGIAPGQAQGKTLAEVFPQMAVEMDSVTESIRTRETKQQKKKPRRTKDGICFEDVTIYPLIANGIEGAVIRIDDVTEQVRLEEMMVQSEKMLSVGGLAAGMAHEINNPLAGMIQTANVMSDRLANVDLPANRKAAAEAGISMESIKTFMEKRGLLRMMKAISESGHRVAAIVDNMLSFARKSEARISAHSLTELMDITLELAATDYDLKKHYDFKMIAVTKAYEETLPPVPCERAQIQQVLLNILRNGAQAMNEQRVKREAQGVAGQPPCFVLRIAREKTREMVRIEIEDNGPGMDEATRKRVFEPFFTTKAAGVGTGLGLSVSYFIITENHGGEMTVESRPGSGTKFIIRLPLHRNSE